MRRTHETIPFTSRSAPAERRHNPCSARRSCFHTAYLLAPNLFLAVLAVCYFACLFQLARLRTPRQAFYSGLAIGFGCVAPQLAFFWNIFGAASIPLWMILAFWIALFLLLAQQILNRFRPGAAVILIPLVWIGLEFFRSELYYLKFSWANWGYVLGSITGIPIGSFGVYGITFLAALCGVSTLYFRWRCALATAVIIAAFAATLDLATPPSPASSTIRMAGIQMEFPLESSIPASLDSVVAEHPEAELLVLSEYTLSGTPTEAIGEWCRRNKRFLIVGGKDPADGENFRNTVFVIDPHGEVVFKQVKSVPIQFFKDGLPASTQSVWHSPWGRIGIAICYDLSYSRVVDELVRQGAQLLVVPTMDVVDWGERQHALHALVAPVRAREYGMPIFRVASSGISQAIDSHGRVVAQAPFPGENAILAARLELATKGTLPVDRWLGPLGVATVASVILLLTLRRPARSKVLRDARLPNRHHEPVGPTSGALS